MPVLWVGGGLDPTYVDLMSAVAERRGDIVHVVPGVGHNVVAEAPGELAAAVDSWTAGS